MLLLLIILTVAVALSGLFVFYWARYPRSHEPKSFGHPKARGLFDATPEEKADKDARAHRGVLLERSRRGDLSALEEAQATGDSALYHEIVDALIDSRDGGEKLGELISFISRSGDLRASPRLAARAMEGFKQSPSLPLATGMLHVAALSDDSGMYHCAVDIALEAWKQGRLGRITGDDLKELIESQFWVLALTARSSGAGFTLKRRLAAIRRELATANAAR